MIKIFIGLYELNWDDIYVCIYERLILIIILKFKFNLIQRNI